MSYDPYAKFGTTGYAAPSIDQTAFDEGLRRHMMRVYNFMLLGLALTGGVAMLTASSPELMAAIFGSPLKWVVMLLPFAFVLVLSFGINRLSPATAQLVFWLYSAAMGLSLSAIFLVFTGASIAKVFFITSAMFAGASLWGYTTKADLTKMGAFFMMGLIGVIIATLVNLFLQSSALDFAISFLCVIIFTALTAYDTQNIKEMYAESHGSDANSRMALMGALSLYLNFINIFMSLLNLLGERE